VSFAAFVMRRELYDPIYPTATLVIVYVILVSAMLAASNRKLRLERVMRDRLEGELNAAREIQMGMLPDPTRIDKLPPSVRLHAFLEPARTVGGDLYDLCMIDDRHLFFLVGDVSGKGVSASLFMALSKALCRNVAMRENLPVNEVTEQANGAISRENPGELFITAVAGMLDTATGDVDVCVAGHDAPLVLGADRSLREVQVSGGPPLCVVEDFPYQADHFHLEPGETIVLSTDGIAEAMTVEKEMYGRERLRKRLRSLAPATGPREMVQAVYDDVKAFVRDAEANDDLTIMAIQYVGRMA
jgi:serine phosphatase RsbU (regulator of sigma subunit)